MWAFNRRTDHVSAAAKSAIIEGNRRAAYVAVKALRWLATEMVALCSHSTYEGKFLTQYSLLADFDPAARSYLDRLDRMRHGQIPRKPDVNILSATNTRRPLAVMRDMVISNTVEAMKVQGVCSIIADGTQDESKMEACCLLLMYIELNDENVPHPVERTVGVFTTGDTSGASLSKEIVDQLQAAGVDMSCIIGQSYDVVGNMSGKYQGLHTKISELQPSLLQLVQRTSSESCDRTCGHLLS